jgi:hypothetical protein
MWKWVLGHLLGMRGGGGNEISIRITQADQGLVQWEGNTLEGDH